MINEKELQISNKSYTNKDFQDIYPEILAIANKLSERWKPQSSNESDPGIVLLKLLGFMGDKLNYNIDKNVLECFLPSATQMSSVRNLCELGGYSPRYYQSAKSKISVMYQGSLLADNNSFTLMPFETVFTDAERSKTYILTSAITISEPNTTVNGEIVEGQLETLSVGGITQITTEYLDDNNRIYFPEQYVAENGIYIFPYGTNISYAEFWNQVSNLNTIQSGIQCYKFGYDSVQQLPYIEFPKDIAELIGEGLTINYIRTTGSQGNISAGFLTQLAKPGEIIASDGTSVYPSSEENADGSQKTVLVISNMSATNLGADPETIDEAYNSFKRQVGTLETLVTCRDYANYIYDLLDEGQNVVSNIQVADRRTDYNYSDKILTFTDYGQIIQNKPDTSSITPYDLCLYPLRPINTVYNAETFVNSFTPLYDTAYITSTLEEGTKSISHQFKELDDDDVYAFKAMYKLNIKIATKYKVNAYEQEEIKANIRSALYKNFNAREVDYGYEIPYDTLLKVIENADPRIKVVMLEEPDIHMNALMANGEEILVSDNTEEIAANYIAKNVLAGTVSLFDFDTDFVYDFNQKLAAAPTVKNASGSTISLGNKQRDYRYDNIMSVTTECQIKATPSEGSFSYTLGKNEVLQAVAELLTSADSFGAYTYFYYFNGESTAAPWNESYIPANETHTLSGAEFLVVVTEQTPYYKVIKLLPDKRVISTYSSSRLLSTEEIKNPEGVNTMICPSFDLRRSYATDEDSASGGKIYSRYQKLDVLQEGALPQPIKNLFGDGKTYPDVYMLTTDENIDRKTPVFINLASNGIPCYWIRTVENNCLFTPSECTVTEVKSGSTVTGHTYVFETILGDDESFIYSDASLNGVEVLGSGTKITYTYATTGTTSMDISQFLLDNWSIIDETVSTTDLNEYGLAAFGAYTWKYKNFQTYNLKLTRMQMLTLTEGDSFSVGFAEDDTEFTIGNAWRTMELTDGRSFSYMLADGTSSEDEGDDGEIATGLSWKFRTRLDLNCNQAYGQKLINDGVSKHIVTLKCNNNEYASVSNDTSNVYYVTLEGDSTDTTYDTYVTFSMLIQAYGNENIDFSVYNAERSTSASKVYQFPVKAFFYKDCPLYINGTLYEYSSEGYLNIPLVKIGTEDDPESSLGLNFLAPKGAYVGTSTTPSKLVSTLMIYYNNIDDEKYKISVDMVGCNFNHIDLVAKNGPSSLSSNPITLRNGVNIIAFTPTQNNCSIEFSTVTWEDAEGETKGSTFQEYYSGLSLLIGLISNAGNHAPKTLSYNSSNIDWALSRQFDSDSLTADYLKTILNKVAVNGGEQFYWNAPIDELSLVDVVDVLSAPAFFDANNIANNMTIPQLIIPDSTGSSDSVIEIVRTSRA